MALEGHIVWHVGIVQRILHIPRESMREIAQVRRERKRLRGWRKAEVCPDILVSSDWSMVSITQESLVDLVR